MPGTDLARRKSWICRSLPAACPRRSWPSEAGLTPVRKMVPGCQADGRRTKATRMPSDSAEVAVIAARAATGAPRTAPTATSSSRPSLPPSSHPSARSGAGGSPRAAARSLDAIDNSAPVVAATVSTSTPRASWPFSAHSPSPARMAASPTRSNSPSSSAPRGPPRSWSRATSPSTPSATELAWTSSPPARPWPTASSAAPARPNVNATSDTRSGAGRSGASSIDSRVDSGRLSRRLTGPQGTCLGQAGDGTGQAVITFGGCLVLAAEHLGREQERAAVDGRLVQVLAEGDHGPVHHPNPSSRFPARATGRGIDEHSRLTGRQQPDQCSLAEDMVGGDQQEQRFALDLALNRSQRRAVAICPPVGIDDPDPAAPEPAADCRHRPGVVAHNHQDLLEPSGQQGPNGPLDQAQPTQPEQNLEPPPVTDSSRWDRPAASTTPTRGRRDSSGAGRTMSA